MSSTRAASLFDRQVDAWILADAGRVGTFDELVCKLPSVYPTQVREGLSRLRQSGELSKAQHRRLSRRSAPITVRDQHPHAGSLPPPHPLDYDWRYSENTIDHLLEVAVSATVPGETIALLGTPSLHVSQLDRRLGRRFVLIDSSAATVHQIRTMDAHRTSYRRDLLIDPVPTLGAAVVIADPPWYAEHIQAFLWTASECARHGATVLVSLPAVGTRPGSLAERKAFRSVAKRMSLRICGMEPGFLTYSSPPFEVNALAAAGLPYLPSDWRRGDLAILQKSGPSGERPRSGASEPRWDEQCLGWSRVRVRRDRPGPLVDPTLNELVPGGVLADVSRRHQYQRVANVWTSGNRVYVTKSPRVLLAILDAMSKESNPHEAVASIIGRAPIPDEDRAIAISVDQVKWLARIERRELAH